MPASKINFHAEDLDFQIKSPLKIKAWLKEAAKQEGHYIQEINYIFCSDAYLLEINKEHLQHDFLTDIITFDNSESPLKIEADIFISIERVMENAATFKQPFETELRRVIVHGLLHLMGYKDKSAKDKARMRSKEDAYLSLG